jgi:mRNA interferase HigB
MKIAGRIYLEEFASRHSDARSQIDAWLFEAEEAQWLTPCDVRKQYAHASFMADNRVVFNLKGNKYRLDTKISYKNHVILIMRIGTHKEYDGWKF